MSLTDLTENITIFIICHFYKLLRKDERAHVVFSSHRAKIRLTQVFLSVYRSQRWEPLLWKMNSVCFKSSLLSDSTQNQLKMCFLYETTVSWYMVYDWLRLSVFFCFFFYCKPCNMETCFGVFIMFYTCMFFIISLLTIRAELKVFVTSEPRLWRIL